MLVSALLAAGSFALAAEPKPLRDVFRSVNPSVVIVRTTEPAPPIPGDSVPATQDAEASGVLVAADGRIITAAHAVQVADTVAVEFLDGTVVSAVVVGTEPAADLALLRVERVPERARPIDPADSDAVEVGDEVFVIGALYGISHVLSVGHVSARHRAGSITGGFELAEFFQTDAAINAGNSGGPLFTRDGRLVGIVSHIISQSGGFEGLGFAVTSNTARRLLLDGQSFWSGVEAVALDDELARLLNVPQRGGLLVQRVSPTSLAAKLGIRGGTVSATVDDEEITLGGDVVLSIFGVAIEGEHSLEEIRRARERAKPGERVTVKVLRAGRVLELHAPLS